MQRLQAVQTGRPFFRKANTGQNMNMISRSNLKSSKMLFNRRFHSLFRCNVFTKIEVGYGSLPLTFQPSFILTRGRKSSIFHNQATYSNIRLPDRFSKMTLTSRLQVGIDPPMPLKGGENATSSINIPLENHQTIEEKLSTIECLAEELNNGEKINLNSPRRISLALYHPTNLHPQHQQDNNTIGSTTKKVLMEMAHKGYYHHAGSGVGGGSSISDGTPASDFQRQLAALVLEYRELKKNLKHTHGIVGDGNIIRVGTGGDSVSLERKSRHQMTSNATFSTSNTAKNRDTNDYDRKNIKTTPFSMVPPPSPLTSSTTQTYETIVDSLFAIKGSKIDNYWYDPMKQITKPSSRSLVTQLNPSCPMGYDPLATPLDSLLLLSKNSNGNGRGAALSSTPTSTTTTTAGKKGSLLSYVRTQKEKYNDCIVLTRVGEFYEAFGLDAALLVEHCGLNPMAGKARAGCPIKNIQNTLDCLTNVGFRVAVYEEALDTDSSNGRGGGGTTNGRRGAKTRIKNRMLAQIVSSASPTYLYDLVLSDAIATGDTLAAASSSDFASTLARPHVGIISTSAGYTMVEVSSEERTARVSERMTAEAVACRLAAYPPADPLFYVPSRGEEASGKTNFDSTLPGSSSLSASSLAVTLPFLPSRSDVSADGPGSRLSVKVIPAVFMPDPVRGVSDLDRAKQCIVTALLQLSERCYEFDFGPSTIDDATDARISLGDDKDGRNIKSKRKGSRVTHDDFTLIPTGYSSYNTNGGNTHTNPLYAETANQLGLMSDLTIPPLVRRLLPNTAPTTTHRFLRRWLLTPPPPPVASAMSNLISLLREDGSSLPPLSVPPIGKVLALIRAGQASAHVFREVLSCMSSTISILDTNNFYDHVGKENHKNNIVGPLMILLQHESGIAAEPNNLKQRCLDCMQIIREVVSVDAVAQNLYYYLDKSESESESESVEENISDRISNYGEVIPAAFFERNEGSWRGRVKPSAAKLAYAKVELTALKLAEVVAADFWGVHDLSGLISSQQNPNKSPIVQDVFNNLFAIKDLPSWWTESNTENGSNSNNSKNDKYFHPRDRNGKVLRNRYTTTKVANALSNYIEACDDASKTVTAVLTELSETLCDTGHLPAVTQAAHANLILSTAAHHAANANSLGWSMAKILDESNVLGPTTSTSAGKFKDLWPYWMDRTDAVKNSFDLNGLFLLTAPNMSGKSTLMRATAAAALLTNCGLCAPVADGSVVRRFDSIFVRGASSDVPSENKSAFGAEMGDVAALLRCCGDKSLVFVDELGRGTSPKDGTSLAGAILEAMASAGMSGVFATHLHGILELPLNKKAQNRIVKKQMAVHDDGSYSRNSGGIQWTYKLVDGVCTESLALVTASRFGVPEEILNRAKSFKCENVIMDPNHEEDNSVVTDNSKSNLRLEDITKIIEQLCGSTVAHIPPRWTAPPSLEGRSCVYVLEIDENKPRYYVGETDSFSQRLRQHREKGEEWAKVNAIAVAVRSKSDARNVESRLIRKLATEGFELISTTDGRKIRSPNNTRC